MVRYWLGGAAALALTMNFASAQTMSSQTTVVTQPAVPAAAPTQSYSETHSERVIDSNGVETNKTEHLEKSQSITSGNGALSAQTHVETGGATTVVVPPVVTTYRSTTTTSTTDK